jgi:hypothetical protein
MTSTKNFPILRLNSTLVEDVAKLEAVVEVVEALCEHAEEKSGTVHAVEEVVERGVEVVEVAEFLDVDAESVEVCVHSFEVFADVAAVCEVEGVADHGYVVAEAVEKGAVYAVSEVNFKLE